MIDTLTQYFSFPFVRYAFIVGVLISLCSSLLGVTLVLKRFSFIGDGLSHVSFGAFAIATVLGIAPLEFALPLVIVVSFLILRLNENSKIHGDSAIALISAGSLAIGTFVVSIVKGVNIDIHNYLFGSILAVSYADLVWSMILSFLVIIIYVLFYSKIFAITFDESFASSIGIKANFYNGLFSVLCSVVVVIGMRLVGSLLLSSFIIFPTLCSMQVFKNFKSVVFSSALISVLSFVTGLLLSYYLATPTGASIVLVHLVVFLGFSFISFCLSKR